MNNPNQRRSTPKSIPMIAALADAREALEKFQDGPDLPRPNAAQTLIPIIGPAWQAAGDLQDGNYGAAAFNGLMAVGSVLPAAPAVRGLYMLSKGVPVLKGGSVTADAARKALKAKGLTGPGKEVHHTVALRGNSRNAQDPRNHYALLKVMPQDQHRRLTGSWGGEPSYGPIGRVWHGTNDWQKAVPAGLASYGADQLENKVQRNRRQK